MKIIKFGVVIAAMAGLLLVGCAKKGTPVVSPSSTAQAQPTTTVHGKLGTTSATNDTYK